MADENFKIFRRYLTHKAQAEKREEPDVRIEFDEQFINTTKSIRNHKRNVRKRMLFIADEIIKRADMHDDSKLDYPELGWLVAMDKEGRAPYGSEAYFEKMKRWDCFFKHHYRENTHHPDHYDDKTYGMNIIDIVEMMCDVISYFDELESTKAFEIIDEQAERFGLSEELASILKATLTTYFAYIKDVKPEFNAKKVYLSKDYLHS